MISLVHKAAGAAKWSALEVFMRQGMVITVSIILAHILAPEEFGTIAVLTVYTGVAAVLIDGGLGAALIQRQDVTHVDESATFFFNLGMGAVFGALLCVAAPWIARAFTQPVLQDMSYAMACNLFVGTFGSIHTTLLTKEMNFKVMAKVGAISSVVSGGLAIYMASAGYGVWSLVGYAVASTLVTVVLLWICNPWRPGWSFRLASLRSLFRFGGYEMAAALLDVLAANLYVILIGKLYSVRDVGLFGRAKNTQLMPLTIMMGIIQRVAYSAFSLSAQDAARIVRGLRQAQAIVMFIHMPIMVGMILLAEPLVLTLFGAQWMPCVPMLQVLALGGILWPLLILNQDILKAQGHTRLLFKNEVMEKVIAISLLVAASQYGIMAMAWTTVVLSVCGYVIRTHYTKVLLAYGGLSQLRDLRMNFVAVIPMAAAVCLLAGSMETLPIIELIVSGAIGCGVYLVTCRLLCRELLSQCLVLAGVRIRPATI